MEKLNFQTNTVRRLFNILGFIFPMFTLIGLAFITCSYKYVGVSLLTDGFAFT